MNGLAGVGTAEYDRILRQSFYEAEAVLVLNPITAAMLEPYARRVCIVPWGIDPARFPWPEERRIPSPDGGDIIAGMRIPGRDAVTIPAPSGGHLKPDESGARRDEDDSEPQSGRHLTSPGCNRGPSTRHLRHLETRGSTRLRRCTMSPRWGFGRRTDGCRFRGYTRA